MAGFASYSGQTFNCLVGLTVSVWMMVKQGETDFDIFGIYSKETTVNWQNWFLILLIGHCLGSLGLHLVYYLVNGFTIGRKFAYSLIGIYGVFLIGSILLGVLSSGQNDENSDRNI